jgi:hypothetical protein
MAVVALIVYWVSITPVPADVDNFWNVDPANPYEAEWGDELAYVYSPAFAQVIGPVTTLSFDAFYRVWTAISLTALAWLITPIGALVALALPLVRTEIEGGQIHLWITLAIVVSLRLPGAWALPILTKVTPGIGVLWFAARREWRRFGIAIGITGGIVFASVLIDPNAWIEWLQLLRSSATLHMDNVAASEWPIIYRLPIAAGLAIMAGWRNRPAALPLIACFALPAIWPWSLVMMAGVPRLLRPSPVPIIRPVEGTSVG